MIRNPSTMNVSQEAARATLREVRLQGHIYVELREVGRRTIFFCTLCLTPCYSDASLFDHLRGNLHARRYAAAKATLFGPGPWPFNDGVLFFSATGGQEHRSSASVHADAGGHEATPTSDGLDLLNSPTKGVNSGLRKIPNSNGSDCGSSDKIVSSGALDNGNGAIKRGKAAPKGSPANGDHANGRRGKSAKLDTREKLITIPRALPGNSSSAMRVSISGYGHIATRISRADDDTANKIRRIWCAWLGTGDSDPGEILRTMPKCDFGVINFSYSYDLGRPSGWDDAESSPPSGSCDQEEGACSPRKSIKSSPPEVEEGERAECSSSNRSFRRELRWQKRLAAERMCDICGQPMLAGKDVAALLSRKTWHIACSSRNTHGAFHVFHTSCLIQWILLCESEVWNPKLPNKKASRGRRGKKSGGARANMSSVLCPECQGTGAMHADEDDLEQPSIPLSQMFQYKLKAIESHKAWMKDPEILEHCSTGLSFSSDSEESVEVSEDFCVYRETVRRLIHALFFFAGADLAVEIVAFLPSLLI